ncbi:MAG: hypothetical protein J1E95_11600 [Muribaculaceae bacterium]|nr:hypothetical protein [Muribaculaceae bacterium]
MKPEQLEKVLNFMQGEVNSLKEENHQLKQRLETLEKQGMNSNSDPVDNLSLNVSINERIQKRVAKELSNLPELVTQSVRNLIPNYVSTSTFNSFKNEINSKIVEKKDYNARNQEILDRISTLETKKVKRFSFLTVNRTTNEYYKDEVEKKLWDKYGYWLKNKKDIIWCFICMMIIMWAIIAIQWFQINYLEESLNPIKEKVEMSIGEQNA